MHVSLKSIGAPLAASSLASQLTTMSLDTKTVEKNILCWIAKVSVKITSNQLKNVLSHHKLIEYLATVLSKGKRLKVGAQ